MLRADLALCIVALVTAACGSSSVGSNPGGNIDGGVESGSGGGTGDASSHADATGTGDGGTTAEAGPDGTSPQEGGATGDGGPGPAIWAPTSSAPLHLHWQLSTALAIPGDVVAGQTVYDIDGETNSAATVASLHALGPDVKVICYVDVGTYENYRSDAASFPASVLGATNGWPGEQWLDVRQQSVLLPIMKARFQNWCIAKGFDAIEPDNLDGWENTTGFPLTQADGISYVTAIASLAHSLGLSIGLKNLPDQAANLEPTFDWALDEQCFQYAECSSYTSSFLAKGKAVWDIEYSTMPDCTTANTMMMNAEFRDLNLVGPSNAGYVYDTCVPDTQTTW
jgi:hypothetical protein